MTVHVVARLTARPDTGAELQTLLLSLIEPTRQEVGCLPYELLQNAADPTDFTFVEEWADSAALEAHSATPHLPVSRLGASAGMADCGPGHSPLYGDRVGALCRVLKSGGPCAPIA